MKSNNLSAVRKCQNKFVGFFCIIKEKYVLNVKEYITFLGTAGNLNCKKSGTKLPLGTYKNSSVKLLWVWSVKTSTLL